MSYSFPILPNPEIITCLSEMGHHFTKEELNQPTAPMIREFCEDILVTFTGYNKSTSHHPNQYGIDKLTQGVELFTQDGAIGEITFLRAMSNLMRVVGLFDFTYKDIYKPEAARVRKMFSGIINLGKFMELKISIYSDLDKFNKTNCEERDLTLGKEQKLLEELENKRMKKNEKDLIVNGLMEQLQQDDQRLKQANHYQNEQCKLITIKTNKNESIKQDITNLASSIENTIEECSRMEALIVPSPDKIKKVLQDMKHRLSIKKDGLKEFEPTMSKLQNKFKQLEKINKNIQTTLELVETYQKENKIYKSTKKLSKETLKVNQDQNRQMNELELDIQKFNGDLLLLDENLKRNRDNYIAKKADLMNLQSELKNQKALIEKERESTQIKIDHLIKELDSVRASIAQLKSNHEKEKREIFKSFSTLVDSIHTYHLQLFNLMENNNLIDQPQHQQELQ
ncbi:hypothetical protein RB653_004124 [Dictyostelium firmibasis]|uniref:Kinetochore protein Nuf2 N-terminal domain-containing protein n=1 Tax=Dictyostelium firmibasis TaxID=79012 RepID=A0AAN7TZ38_9MYCE